MTRPPPPADLPGRPLLGRNLVIWHSVAAAGPAGLTIGQLGPLHADVGRDVLRASLQSLAHGHYVRRTGTPASGRWVAGVRTPLGAEQPGWQRGEPWRPSAAADEMKMPARPASVFSLAAAPVPTGWTISGKGGRKGRAGHKHEAGRAEGGAS